MMFVGCGLPRFVVCAVLAALTLNAGPVLAGTSYQKALAAVAVVRVRLQMAKRAKLGDQKKRNGSGALPVRTDDTADAAIVLEEEIVQAALKPEVDPVFQAQHFERIQFTPDPVGPTLIEDTGIASATPPEQVIEESPRRAMRFVMDNSADASLRDAPAARPASVLPAQLVVRVWPYGCQAGEEQVQAIDRELKPLKWKIGRDANSQIKLETGDRDTESCPQIFLFKNGVEIKRWDRKTPCKELSDALRAAWDDASKKPGQAYAARGSAGVIHAARDIREMREWLRKYPGEGVPLAIDWDRPQDVIGLKAGSDWSPVAVLGGRGHVSVRAKGGSGIPVDGVSFGYALQGGDVQIENGTLRLIGVLDNLKFSESAANAGPEPVGLFVIDDVVWVGGLLNAFSAISSLLNPVMDLNLPSHTSLTVTLNGDVITAEFGRGPTVRIVALFQFNLLVKKVLITDKNVHAEFSGSQWIQSRDWTVAE